MLKSKWILIPTVALLLLSGCVKQVANPNADAEPSSPVSEEQTVPSVSGNMEAEIALPLDDETSAANKPEQAALTGALERSDTTSADRTTATEQNETTPTAKTTVPDEPTVLAGSTARQTTQASSAQEAGETLGSVGSKTASTTHSGTLPTANSGKDQYELPAIPLK